MDDIIGTGWAFPPHFVKATGDVEMASGESEIEGSLTILFSTKLGERLFRPDFGCNLDDYLFLPMETSAIIRLRRTIEQAVIEYEPRIDVLDIDLEGTDFLEGKLRISLKYTLKDSYADDNRVYPFYYENNL